MKTLLTFFFLFFSSSVLAENWIITYDDGHIVSFKFHNDNTCSYKLIISPSGNQGKLFSHNCTWKKNANLLFLEVNDYYSVDVGLIEGNTIAGNATTLNSSYSNAKFTGIKTD